jgi:hypothetical protein
VKLKTEFKFVLPQGAEDDKDEKMKGVMRLVKVKDLLDVYRDTRVKDSPSYFYVVLLSRLVTKLGDERMINTRVIENLSTENFTFLVDFMNEINHTILSRFPVKCGTCGTMYTGEVSLVGEP